MTSTQHSCDWLDRDSSRVFQAHKAVMLVCFAWLFALSNRRVLEDAFNNVSQHEATTTNRICLV